MSVLDRHDPQLFGQNPVIQERLLQKDAVQRAKARPICEQGYLILPCYVFSRRARACTCPDGERFHHNANHAILEADAATDDFDLVDEWLRQVPGISLMVFDESRLGYLDTYLPLKPPFTKSYYNYLTRQGWREDHQRGKM